MKKKSFFILNYLKQKVRQEAPISHAPSKKRLRRKPSSFYTISNKRLARKANATPHKISRRNFTMLYEFNIKINPQQILVSNCYAFRYSLREMRELFY